MQIAEFLSHRKYVIYVDIVSKYLQHNKYFIGWVRVNENVSVLYDWISKKFPNEGEETSVNFQNKIWVT